MENTRVFLSNIHVLEEHEPTEAFVTDMERFLTQKRICCVLCVNVWKNAKIFSKIFEKTRISLSIPYILIIAGTDANVAIKVFLSKILLNLSWKEWGKKEENREIRERSYRFSVSDWPDEENLPGGDPWASRD